MKIVAGVSSGRYGYMVPGWKSSPQGKVPKDFSNEELNEGMTSSVARMSAIVLKKRVVGSETGLKVLMMYHRNLITYQNKSLRLGVLCWWVVRCQGKVC